MARILHGIIKDIWAGDPAIADTAEPIDTGYTILQGWRDTYSNPGGKNPEREVFNAILRKLYSFAKDVQSHGILEWVNNAEVGYTHPAIVSHNKNKWYITRQNVPAGLSPDDPNNNEYWQEIFFSSSRSANDADKTDWRQSDSTVISFLRHKPKTVPLETEGTDNDRNERVTGTANNIALAPIIVVRASTDTSGAPKLVEGLTIRFKAKHTSTGSVSINVSELGSKPLNYSPGTSRVGSGGIRAGYIYTIYYDGNGFIILSESQGTQSTSRTGEVVAYAGELGTYTAGGTTPESTEEAELKALKVDGRSLPKVGKYNALYLKLRGSKTVSPYGETSDRFNLPNIVSKFIQGASSDGQLSRTGGQKTTSFDVPVGRHRHSLPRHSHTYKDLSIRYEGPRTFASQTAHGSSPPYFVQILNQYTSDTARTTSKVSGETEWAGSSTSQSINLMNPYIRLNYIIYL